MPDGVASHARPAELEAALDEIRRSPALYPDAPVIITPAEGATVDRAAVTVNWEPVTSPNGVEVEVYSLQLFPVDPPEGQGPPKLNIDFTLARHLRLLDDGRSNGGGL